MRACPGTCLSLLLLLLLLSAVTPAAAAEIPSEEQKTLYALGVAISRSLGVFALTEAELEAVKAGLTDGVLGKPLKADLQTYGPRIQALQQTRAAAAAAGERKTGQAYSAKAAAEKGATRTASGIVMSTIKAGTGPSPKATDQVKVHYHGTLTDGTVFDSSVQRKEPATFPLNGVIPCWTEAVQLMKVGGKSRIVCPPDLAYGDRGAPPRIRPGATLVFEVELLEIVK
jgi:FKBP-type peptidyl-prolyl cis-trans isomerase FkpA/FKBP-type peptidyl-prolyl cis-trans isomerase FklB